MSISIQRRDDLRTEDDDGWWWYSESAAAIKWAIIAAIFVLFLTFFLGAYLHAQRRMKKGLAPLSYHRWLLPRRQRVRFEPHLAEPVYFYRSADGHFMNQYPPAPPAYTPDDASLPLYTPPQGSSKVNPNQSAPQAPPAGESSRSPVAPAPTHLQQGIPRQS